MSALLPSMDELTAAADAEPAGSDTDCLACARALLLNEAYRGAVKYADKALERVPTSFHAHVVSATAWQRLGKPGKAKKSCKAGLALAQPELLGLDAEAAAAAIETLQAMQAELRAAAPAPAPAVRTPSGWLPPAPAPERIAAPAVKPRDAQAAARQRGERSVWNTKGTWEEYDLTDWAAETLGEAIEGLTAAVATGGTVRVDAVRDLDGNCQYVVFQSKRKFLFDLSFRLDYSFVPADDDAKPLKGRVIVTDVCQDFDGEDYVVDLPMARRDGREALVAALTSRRPADAGLQRGVVEAVKAFEATLRGLPESEAGLPAQRGRSERRKAEDWQQQAQVQRDQAEREAYKQRALADTVGDMKKRGIDVRM
jgi:hypothetical protein